MATIRAVLVGVDRYERPDIPSLKGCVNDVALVRRTLKDVLGVRNEDIRVVVNERATKANILRRLQTTLERAEAGDVVVFYFSGHGSQIRDRDGDELTDRLDELICPYDMDWDRQTYILDDELDALFDAVPPEILLEVFVDCCFWGAGPRELEAEARPQGLRADVRYLPPPLDIAARAEGDEPRVAPPRFFRLWLLRRAKRVLGRFGGRGTGRRGLPGRARPRGVYVLGLPLHRDQPREDDSTAGTAARSCSSTFASICTRLVMHRRPSSPRRRSCALRGRSCARGEAHGSARAGRWCSHASRAPRSSALKT